MEIAAEPWGAGAHFYLYVLLSKLQLQAEGMFLSLGYVFILSLGIGLQRMPPFFFFLVPRVTRPSSMDVTLPEAYPAWRSAYLHSICCRARLRPSWKVGDMTSFDLLPGRALSKQSPRHIAIDSCLDSTTLERNQSGPIQTNDSCFATCAGKTNCMLSLCQRRHMFNEPSPRRPSWRSLRRRW